MIIDKKEYERRIEEEKRLFNKDLYNENLTEKANAALSYFLNKFQERVKKSTGKTVWEYVIDTVNEKIKNKSSVRILALGSGPGGGEINLAKQFIGSYIMECLDINEESIRMGQTKADELGLNIKFRQEDINKLNLTPDYYDIVYAHAALHHMINLEHISQEVKKSMKSDAEFIVYDGITRNGLLLWPETKAVATPLFRNLPEKYRYHHTSGPEGKLVPRIDLSENIDDVGFECIRSEELYPILKQEFKTKIEVKGFSFARRFVDNDFGPNYDLQNPFDKAILDTILRLDEEYTASHNLKPEAVFLVLTK